MIEIAILCSIWFFFICWAWSDYAIGENLRKLHEKLNIFYKDVELISSEATEVASRFRMIDRYSEREEHE